jgi:hypothetical protein
MLHSCEDSIAEPNRACADNLTLVLKLDDACLGRHIRQI